MKFGEKAMDEQAFLAGRADLRADVEEVRRFERSSRLD